MSQYTPTTRRVADVWERQTDGDHSGASGDEYREFAAQFDRWLAGVKAEVWDEGALWAAVECGAVDDEKNQWLAIGENPYREVVE
jgi:hypothetical protein